MHIYSVLNKLLGSKIEQTNALNNTSEQIENFQGKDQEKFSASSQESDVQPEVVQKITSNTQQTTSLPIKDKKESQDSCYALFPKDGDTFVGMHNNEKKTFRLAGIDTPEKGSMWSKEATLFLREKIGKKVVYLTFLGKDPYFREIVEVFLDKEKTQHVNKMLLQEGLASSERYKDRYGNKTHNVVEHLKNEITETVAKVKGKGMWGGPPDDADLVPQESLAPQDMTDEDRFFAQPVPTTTSYDYDFEEEEKEKVVKKNSSVINKSGPITKEENFFSLHVPSNTKGRKLSR